MKLAMVVLFGGLMLNACTADEATEEATVLPVQIPCIGFVTQMCIQIERASGENYSAYGIEGFEPRWGYEARIRMHIGEVPPGLQDAVDPVYLDELIAETRVINAPFDLPFEVLYPGYDGWFSGTQSPLSMRGTPVECEPEVCDALRATNERTDVNTRFSVTFELTATENVLRATAIH